MPRAGSDIADGFQPGAAQAGDDCFVGAERRHRQRPDRIGFLALPDDAAVDMTGHRPRAHGRAGDGGADGKTLRGQHVAHQPHHRGLAAEQMHAAGDVEQQAVRGIERHQRREAIAPTGDGVQRADIGGFVGVEHFQLRTDGAGIGERQAYIKTEPRGRVVERKNLQCVVLLGDDDAGISVSRRDAVARWRLMRSMGRRGSHRLRIRRRFLEKALITFPFHDPAANRAMTVADKLRVEHRRAPCAP